MAGSNKAIKMPMIAITTRSSTRVNPRDFGVSLAHLRLYKYIAITFDGKNGFVKQHGSECY
jgi:hypothetical protein